MDKNSIKSVIDTAKYDQREAPVHVSYSETRKVKLKDQVLKANRIVAGNAFDTRAEYYRQLRSQVLSEMKRNNWRTLAITGPNEGVGKSLTAINLAITISQEVNQTVLLVDLDLRTPSIHKTLGIDIQVGIVDHLTKGVPIEKILINPGYERLVILPGVPQGRMVSELLTSPKMKNFLVEVTTRYPDRLIIFDLPPLLRNDDAMAFTPYTEACLLVVEEGRTKPDEVKRSLELLPYTKLLGTVLNKVRK